MPKPPPIQRNPYNQSLAGVYGEFGSGAGSHAFYLQSAMSPRDLDRISLVSDIPGSERWPIRALFQREIDTQQVTDRLIPYLRDINQVRFFNPLTLTLLPMDERGHTVLPSMPTPTEDVLNIGGQDWQSLERKDFYRLRWIPDAYEYAVLEWNDTRSRLVAIDGQHRLFGLKSLWRDKPEVPPGEKFLRWRIPVVVVSFRGGEDSKSVPTVLDTVRSIFVSINTQAQPVNEARRILLSDDSINAVCTQELIQAAHSNDTDARETFDITKVPLVFFDWRGIEHKREPVRSPAALKTIVEVRDWFKHYLLGDDFTKSQKAVMEVTPLSNLHTAFHTARLTHEQAESVRSWARGDILPALGHLLENFEPYCRYIAALRTLECQSLDPGISHIRRHAFDQLRFGSNRGEESIQGRVRAEVTGIISSIDAARKKHLDKLIAEDIGMRGIVCAFGHLRTGFYGPPTWVEYAGRFTDSLNRLRGEGWISLEPKAKNRKFLRHVAEDHVGEVANYRLGDAKNALGALVALLVAAYGIPWPTKWRFSWDAAREAQLEKLAVPLRRGFRRQTKAELKEKYPDDGTLTREVDKRANAHTQRRLRELRSAANEIVAERNLNAT